MSIRTEGENHLTQRELDNEWFITNSSGHVRCRSEKKLHYFLWKHYLPIKFHNIQHECWFCPKHEIDFLALDGENMVVLVEVKNWFVTIKDVEQICGYLCLAREKYGCNNFRFLLVCGGVEPIRKGFLESCKVEIVLTEEILNGC